MKTNYLKEMRIARYCVLQGIPDAQKAWKKKLAKKKTRSFFYVFCNALICTHLITFRCS